MENTKWLTIAELAEKSKVSEIEAQKLVQEFGKFMAPINFGGVVKYPPTAVESIILINELYRQGSTGEEITEILSQRNHLAQESLREQLGREVSVLVMLQNQACQVLSSVFEVVESLMAEVETLTAKLAVAEREIANLKEKP